MAYNDGTITFENNCFYYPCGDNSDRQIINNVIINITIVVNYGDI